MRSRTFRRLVIVLSLAAGVGSAVFALLLSSGGSAEPDEDAVPAPLLLVPEARQQLPPLPTEVLVPPAPTLMTLHSSVFLVNFWASWCVPCKKEAPALRAFAARGGPIVGVNVSDRRADARAFIREQRWTFSNLRDSSPTAAARFDLRGIPTTLAIDADGRIALVMLGPQTLASLQRAIARLKP